MREGVCGGRGVHIHVCITHDGIMVYVFIMYVCVYVCVGKEVPLEYRSCAFATLSPSPPSLPPPSLPPPQLAMCVCSIFVHVCDAIGNWN